MVQLQHQEANVLPNEALPTFSERPAAHGEVPSTGSAPGHFPGGLYEGVNFAPFVTSFSSRRTAS